MSENSKAAVSAVQESVVNLLELVERASRELSAAEVAELRDEAQKTVLMLIAAIVLADNKYDAGEQAFVGLLVDWSQKPGGEAHYLNEYAERWRTACLQVPHFIRTGADHDLRNNTEITKEMMREIQLIGNNTCVSDGHFDASEHTLLRNYITFLEEYLKARRSQQNAPAKATGSEGWTSV